MKHHVTIQMESEENAQFNQHEYYGQKIFVVKTLNFRSVLTTNSMLNRRLFNCSLIFSLLGLSTSLQ